MAKMGLIRLMFGVSLGMALVSHSSAQGVRRSSVALNRPLFASQQASQWCWAASISNLFAYHGHDVSQARIVSEVYGSVANMRGGDYSNTVTSPQQKLAGRIWRAVHVSTSRRPRCGERCKRHKQRRHTKWGLLVRSVFVNDPF